jgi:hypothetical protein
MCTYRTEEPTAAKNGCGAVVRETYCLNKCVGDGPLDVCGMVVDHVHVRMNVLHCDRHDVSIMFREND